MINPFKFLDFKTANIQNSVIEIFSSHILNRKTSLNLFSHLFECFSFDFRAFVDAYIKQGWLNGFLSYLIQGIYYNEIPVSHFTDSRFHTLLEWYLLTLLAECLSSKSLLQLLEIFPSNKKQSLISYCCAYPREGSWKILQQLGSDVDGLLISKYYNPLTDSSNRQKEALREVKTIASILPEWSYEELVSFFKVFGLHGYYINPAHVNSVAEILQMSLEVKRSPEAFSNETTQNIKSFVDGLLRQLNVFHRHPEKYLKGLEILVHALPTRGSDFSVQPWLPSILAGLDLISKHLNFDKSSFPIIIFDQSPHERLKKNRAYSRKLGKSHGVKIWHLSKDEALQLAAKVGVDEWINIWGYGGSRNCVFFLAPLIHQAARMGKKSINSVLKMKQRDLRMLFASATMGIGGQDLMIHMGEDDVYIPPSHLFLNALFAYDNRDRFISRPVYCIGRATHEVIPAISLSELQQNPASAFFSTHWNPFPVSGRFKGMVTKPKFCLPLPFGNEELHVIPSYYESNLFHQPVIHLGGTRFPKKMFPTSPLDGIEEYLRQSIPYGMRISMCARLTDPSNLFHRCIFPWNEVKSFLCLADVIAFAVLASTIQEMQMRFKRNLHDLPLSEDLAKLINLKPSQNIPEKLTQFYLKMKNEALSLQKQLEREKVTRNRENTLAYALQQLINCITN